MSACAQKTSSPSSCAEPAPISFQNQSVSRSSTSTLVRPNNGFSTNNVTPMQGNGHAETWDGRVFVITKASYNWPNPANGGWYVSVFLPETVTATNGVPQITTSNFSSFVLLEKDGSGSGFQTHNTLAIFPQSSQSQNPFPSDSSGNYSASGAYQTYEFAIVSPTSTSLSTIPPSPYFGNGLSQGAVLGIVSARVIVGNPRTATAFVQSAAITSGFTPFTTITSAYLTGIEPTVTADGQFMIYHEINSTFPQGADDLVASINVNPGVTTGWSSPGTIAALYGRNSALVTSASGVSMPLSERYPITAQPLLKPNGTAFGATERYIGAYPWISLDGTELFHTAAPAGTNGTEPLTPTPPNNYAFRGAESVIGRWTGYALRHIDGAINPNRYAITSPPTVRLLFSLPGATPSFWKPYTDVAGVPIPFSPGRPVYPIFGSNTYEYTEVSFEAHEDKDYVAYYPMNELLASQVYASTANLMDTTANPASSFYDITRTPDISGNFNTASLVAGAHFPNEQSGAGDKNGGVWGRTIYFDQTGYLSAPSSSSLTSLTSAMTVQLFVAVCGSPTCSNPTGTRYNLAGITGKFQFYLDSSLLPNVDVTLSDSSVLHLASTGSALAYNTWYHLAFTVDLAAGALNLYQDGNPIGSLSFSGSGKTLASVANALTIGPGGGSPAPTSVLMPLDEVAISRVARSQSELQNAAYKPASASLPTGGLALPQGLSPSDLRVSGTIDPNQVELGRRLFFEKRLSGSGTVSCATCHDPNRSFTTSLAVAQGVAGPLARNAPTLINRAFSTAQFLDGRAASLEAQAIVPILNPAEMNGDLNAISSMLKSDSVYPGEFQLAFGVDINSQSTSAISSELQSALASFERTVVSGASRVDQFEAGSLTALTASEQNGRLLFRGKARCISCHSGSNYSDESFHNTGFFADAGADTGKYAITGRTKDFKSFKTPTLRNIDLTGPYMHDGSIQTLDQVVTNYVNGGVAGTNIDSDIRPLDLTPSEQADLVAFLKALTGTTTPVAPTCNAQ